MKRQSHKKDAGIVTAFHLTDCTRCGNECAEVCPVYRFYKKYSPQDLARLYLRAGAGGIGEHRLLWGCVTCRACTEACPFDVEFADFIREIRIGRTDYQPLYEGLVHRYQRMQAAPIRKRTGPAAGRGARKKQVTAPKRLSWIDDSLDVNRTRGIVLFVGCTPFFETAFGETCGTRPFESARSAVRILNGLGISPVILENENCCGRDLFDIGDRETFAVLARHNTALLKSRTIKTVLALCPECAYTLRVTYRQLFGKLPFDVMHITEYIARHIDTLAFEKSEGRIAFHDPCYLARYLGCTEAPRAILSAVAGGNLVEMERHGLHAPCCGAGSWVNHGPHTRSAVNERIVEARRCGAEAIVTACPKCMIVFNEVNAECAWKQAKMEVVDLVTLMAKRMRVVKRRK